jgi:hypothetical protein
MNYGRFQLLFADWCRLTRLCHSYMSSNSSISRLSIYAISRMNWFRTYASTINICRNTAKPWIKRVKYSTRGLNNCNYYTEMLNKCIIKAKKMQSNEELLRAY